MSNYSNGPRYTRPPGSERPGPRFPMGHQRNQQRNQFNDFRSQQQQQQPNVNNGQTPANPAATPVAPAPATTTTSEPNSTATSTPTATPTPTTTETNAQESNVVANEPQAFGPRGQKRPAPAESATSSSAMKMTGAAGRSRLFIGNISPDITQNEFQKLFEPYGELIEFFVNPTRGFGFIKLASRQIAERVKHDLDGHSLRGKALRIRFASQGAIVKVKNLSPNVSNELLKEAFEQYFGNVERAVVIVDDRGKSIGEGIVEFEKKPSAQKCLNECTERCFFISSTLKPVIVEPWDTKDEEDGLPEKSLVKNEAFHKERELKPHFAEPNTIEQTIGLKWKELELQEKQLLDEVKRRIQYASEQLQVEIDQMILDHQAQLIHEELARRQEDLRRLNERRSIDFDRRRQTMSMHPPADPMYPGGASMSNNPYPMAPVYHEAMPSNYPFMPAGPTGGAPVPPPPPPPPPPLVENDYPTHPMARGYNHHMGHEYNNQPAQMFDRRRRRN